MTVVKLMATDGVVRSTPPLLQREIIEDLKALIEWWDTRNRDDGDYDYESDMMYPIIEALIHDFQSAAFWELKKEANEWKTRARELGFKFDWDFDDLIIGDISCIEC